MPTGSAWQWWSGARRLLPAPNAVASAGLLLAGALLLATACARAAAELVGPAKVLDGDTLDVQGRRVRLHGIDAPEGDQSCTDGAGRSYRCGDRARAALAGRVRGKSVRCEPRDRDPHGRMVAVCFVGSENVNRWLVEQGLALAYRHYSRDYVDAEEAARDAGRGMWAGSFVTPWKHRHSSARPRTPAVQGEAPAGDCRIKGNINGSGERIYHVPGQQHYADTRIDAARGERYFCTESEARAAGWRKARG
jgi:endonuclease YncB( thermonuclease family)